MLLKAVLPGLVLALVVTAAPADDTQYQEGAAAFSRGDRAKALSLLKPLAEQGNADAQQKLAVIYLGGSGVARDNKQAARWYLKAAEGGNADAQNQLATAYREGLYGLPKDHQQALRWFRTAAEQGHAAARLSLAVMYQNGWGTDKNIDEAVRLTRLTAEQGYADAQVRLGQMYEKGEGVAQSNPEAAKWYRLAADQGSYLAKGYLKSLPVVTPPPIVAVSAAATASARPEVAPQTPPQRPAEQPRPAPLAQAVAPAPSPVVAAAPPAAVVSDDSFDLDKAPASERGRAIPIAGNPAYGSKFTDANGLYTFIMARNWSWERDRNDPRAAHFWGMSGNNHASCAVAPMDYWRGSKSLGDLQAIPEGKALDSFEKGLMTTLGWDKVEKRGTLVLGDGGWPKRTPVKALSWTAANPSGSYDTAVVVEAPANALLVICNTNRPKLGEAVVRLAFRLAEGALTPANTMSSQFALASDPGRQDSVRKIAEADRSGRAWPQQTSTSAGGQNTEREQLLREFEVALNKGDRNAIYRLGPKVKDTRFCQYVDGDPSATPQQIYDGASSCPAGPLFDKLTKRYVSTLSAPQPVSTYGTTPVQSTGTSSQTNWTQFKMQTQHATDAAIRDMNRRIDNAGH
ncbi:MAG: tetratricopeptide repeat protein [Gallionellaceae bacterium]|nr:tetratricopeptide repeat protein [Gallionellaceae bacterium]